MVQRYPHWVGYVGPLSELYVLAKAGAAVRRGVIRFDVVKPAGSAVDFTIYRGASSPRVNGLAGLSGVWSVRSPVIVRDGGDLSRHMQLQRDGMVGVDPVALEAFGPVRVTGVLNSGSVVVSSVRDVVISEDLIGLVVSGDGVPSGTTIEGVDASTGTITLSKPAGATGSASLSASLPVSRGVFEVLDAPVQITGRLSQDDSGSLTVRDVKGVAISGALVGSVVTGRGVPLGTTINIGTETAGRNGFGDFDGRAADDVCGSGSEVVAPGRSAAVDVAQQSGPAETECWSSFERCGRFKFGRQCG